MSAISDWWATWWPWYSGLMGPEWAIGCFVMGLIVWLVGVWCSVPGFRLVRQAKVQQVDWEIRSEDFRKTAAKAGYRIRVMPGAEERVEAEGKRLEQVHSRLLSFVMLAGTFGLKIGPLIMVWPFVQILFKFQLAMLGFGHFKP